MDLYSCIVEKRIVGGKAPNLFTRVHDQEATLANSRGRHGVTIDPSLAFGSNVSSAASHPVRIYSAANFTNSNFLLAATAFLVWYV